MKLMVRAETARQDLEALKKNDPASADIPSLEAFHAETDKEAHKAYRKYADARSRLRVLEQNVEELDPARLVQDADPSVWQSSTR